MSENITAILMQYKSLPLHQAELMKDWDLCQALQQPEPIPPLE
jgi:hypothetical protein